MHERGKKRSRFDRCIKEKEENVFVPVILRSKEGNALTTNQVVSNGQCSLLNKVTAKQFSPVFQQHQAACHSSNSPAGTESGVKQYQIRAKPPNVSWFSSETEKQTVQQEETSVHSPVGDLIPLSAIYEAFHTSKSIGNFAKKIVFLMFSKEERHNRNCSGRVTGNVRCKKKLDPVKLEAVKRLTFTFYRVENPDNIWHWKCVKAIDSALRKENSVKVQE